MDEQFEVRECSTHTYSTAVNPNNNTVLTAFRYRDTLRMAALVLCVQMLTGCGGGATEPETSTETYIWPETYTCTHFVDAVTGADTNSGLSPDNAWASANRATAHTRGSLARAGHAICFKRGQRFEISSGELGLSGSPAAPVFIGAYGDPAQPAPRLSPSIRIDNQPGWVNLGNGVYYWPNSHPHWNVSNLWRAGAWQRPATDQNLSDGSWYYEKANGVYLRIPSGQTFSGAIYLDVNHGVFGVHSLQYIAFRDLTFEYAGAAITGRPSLQGGGKVRIPRAIAYLSIRNCRFEHVAAGVLLMSETVDGKSHENHHIDIQGNQFDDVRFAIRLGAEGNGPELHSYVTIAENSIRNVSINGRYAVHDGMEDVEAISTQNTTDMRIVDNRIEYGVRLEQGIVNVEGELLISNGIDVYRHPAAILQRVRIERNYVNDLARGIVIGSGIESGMHEVTVTNNIISNCAIGLKMNGNAMERSYRASFNTLFRNGINLYISGDPIVHNNFSVGPREYHVVIAAKGSVLDYNVYAPDGRFGLRNTVDSTLDLQYHGLQAFRALVLYGQNHDQHSYAGTAARFVNVAPLAPEHFQLTEFSPARGRGLTINLEDGDFGGRARPAGSGVDVGAWAWHPFDG